MFGTPIQQDVDNKKQGRCEQLKNKKKKGKAENRFLKLSFCEWKEI